MEEKNTPSRQSREPRRPAAGRERPRDPRNGPVPARERTGRTSDREQARRERLSAARAEDEQTREQPVRRVEPGEQPRPAVEAAAKKRKKKKKKTHRVYNTNFGFKFLTMLAVVAVITLGMIIFFKVKHINVVFLGVDGYGPAVSATGLEETSPTGGDDAAPQRGYYTEQEIIDASGIEKDDNLLSLSKAAVASRIHAALPYVNEIQIKKSLPGTVVISVSEFKVTYGIQDETGGWWLLSREGRILEPTDEQEVKKHLILTGMPIQVPQVGDYIKPTASEGVDMSEIAAKRSAAVAILPQLEQTSYAKKISSVDLSSSYNIILWYGTQYEIRIGNTENLTYKLQYLEGVLEELGKDKSGTVDLTFNEDQAAHFLPFG